jgi:transcriptional regulator with XRE-family HTH domain
MKSVADMIRRRREELGLSQEDIARQLVVTSDFIGLCERGLRKIGLDRVPRLAEILEVNPKDLAMIALAEEAPQMAEVIHQGKVSKDFELPDLNQSEQDSFRKLMALDRTQRQPILSTIDALYDMSQVRDNALAMPRKKIAR